ncbi:hypothetical protein G5714_020876 [Onychostoma macrolepis]|uniref:G-protein coupled receptors family 1 profile domain-containing protein n=1 Tax=Onychostoma macrolepis TaxID=369639 RepID=A0A7J6BV24_9TELE|nr:hypothetical protein G5714_020876 [Onychostoma macrolepis]
MKLTEIHLLRESSVSSFEQTDQPIDDNESSTQMTDELGSGSPSRGPDWIIINVGGMLGSRKRPLVSNHSSTPDATATAPTPDTFNILDESADFLKGLMVTRLMPSFYIFIILISLPLNALALVAFTCRIREKKPAVIYMSHLACVDLLFTLLLPLKIHYQLNASDWVFGEAACRVLSAAYYCYMYCSILLMMCMSVDRLLAVVFPIASLTWRSARKATLICTLAWLLALADNLKRAVIMATAVLTEFVVCFAPSSGFLLYHCVCIAMGSNGLDGAQVFFWTLCCTTTARLSTDSRSAL